MWDYVVVVENEMETSIWDLGSLVEYSALRGGLYGYVCRRLYGYVWEGIQ